MGFWIGQEEPPNWSPDAHFRWIPRGTPVRYLGCQVSIELSPAHQIAPLLLTIRKKLLNWSTTKLSFSGRIIVVNNVFLASIWYILSCWIFNKSCITQVQRLVRNFLWSGRAENTRAKVAWSVIVKPQSAGGLGIVDPIDQSRALLGKLVVRGLLPGNELWKTLLMERIVACSPIVGQPWKKEVRWIFQPQIHIRCARKWEDNFINGIRWAWSRLRMGIHLQKLS